MPVFNAWKTGGHYGTLAVMDRDVLRASMHALVLRTGTELPADVVQALQAAWENEAPDSVARETLGIMRESAGLSQAQALPICQDTGSLFAVVAAASAEAMKEIEDALLAAVKGLTAEGILRQNCVDALSDKNTGTNIGPSVPQIHFHPAEGPATVRLMLKGGGSENMSAQYSLPLKELNAARDFDGVKRCVLDAVFRAQGKGCAPGILGVCIGGDRSSGYLLAKEQLFRKLPDINPEPALAALEDRLRDQANRLGIGPMGLGGTTTVLGVKAVAAGRHPASYFVTVSYSCWATRRNGVELDEKGMIAKWL